MIRRAYVRKVEDRLERLEYDIDHLRKRMASPDDDIRDGSDREIRVLRAKSEAVRERIRAVEAAGTSNWGHLKFSVEEGLKELGQAVEEAAARFRKTGSGEH